MAFWRRRREEPKEAEPIVPVEPEAPTVPEAPAEPEVPVEPEPVAESMPQAPIEDPPPFAEPARSVDPEITAPPLDRAIDPAIVDEPTASAPAYAPFDPTAFLAVAPAHTLDQGLERTRGTFMTQLRGYLGGADGPAWDEVEETLIAGDVGATLAIDLVVFALVQGPNFGWGSPGILVAATAGLVLSVLFILIERLHQRSLTRDTPCA